MAERQELPTKTIEKSEWSVRRLFPFTAVAKSFAHTFTNIFDVLLGFSVLTICVAELLNKDVSWLLYVLTMLLLFIAFIERRAHTLDETK